MIMTTDLQNQPGADVLNQMKSQIEQLLILLTQKERFVVEKRFSLGSERRFTLEEIGQQFNVTRERVRQIEKNALHKLKRNAENYGINQINNLAYEFLKESGGIMREELLVSKILKTDRQSEYSGVQFILSLDKRFFRMPNTIKYHPHLRFQNFSDSMIESVCQKSMSYLKKHGDIVQVEKIASEMFREIPECSTLEKDFYLSLFQVHKDFKVMKESVGLMEWRHIHPRTLRDKIYFILRQKNAPLHFVEIGNLIMSAGFDKKGLNMQAVHNELIRYPDFVLIGRGIYALKEWGYNHGTVAEVIESVLKDKESLSEDEIISEVLKKRQVKEITIILNLKNKPGFIRVGRKQYALKKAVKS